MEPIVSILMPVYNAEKYIEIALNSIINQSLKNIEIIAINDASTDGSLDILKKYNDKRLIILENNNNLGVVETLNRGMAIAKGKYLARMDADDISNSHRLEKQLNYLESTNAAICGCNYEVIDINNATIKVLQMPIEKDEITVCLANTVPFAGGSVMMRSDFLKEFKLKYGPGKFAEDYDLWIKIYEAGGIFININEVLYKYRDYKISLSKITKNQNANYSKILRRNFVIYNAKNCIRSGRSQFDKYNNLNYRSKINVLYLAYLLLVYKKTNIIPKNIFFKIKIKEIFHMIIKVIKK
jgi:glycosyltransferase involved in cell wall biosynthesis